jgi:TPP-dependent trihydroxycyclohexane-1,2-dione (THcHDO) dehydratase
MVGDGSYLMLNSEIATSVMLGCKLTSLVLDNRGFGCINRLQAGTGGGVQQPAGRRGHETLPDIDFAAHAASLGALSEKVGGSPSWRPRWPRPRERSDLRHRHRHRPDDLHRGRRRLVGRGGARGCRRDRRC